MKFHPSWPIEIRKTEDFHRFTGNLKVKCTYKCACCDAGSLARFIQPSMERYGSKVVLACDKCGMVMAESFEPKLASFEIARAKFGMRVL